jgi:hypothetical protein
MEVVAVKPYVKPFEDHVMYVVRDAAKMAGVHEQTFVRRLNRGTQHWYSTDLVEGRVLNEIHRAIKDYPPGPGVTVNGAAVSNRKLGHVITTIAPRQSCPDSCRFKKNGCYPDHDNTRTHWDRVTAQAEGMTPEQIAQAEVDLLLKSKRRTSDVRLHIAGDTKTPEAARILAAGATAYMNRARQSLAHPPENRRGRLPRRGTRPPAVWTYTHAWREVHRDDWGPDISVLASCETVADVLAAEARGYVAALVMETFPSKQPFQLEGLKVVPCPYQTRKVKCDHCRLCLNDQRTLKRAGITIGFALHGMGTKKAKEVLRRIPLETV